MISNTNCIYFMFYLDKTAISIAILMKAFMPSITSFNQQWPAHRPHERTFGSGHSLLRPPDFYKDAKHKGIGAGTWRKIPCQDKSGQQEEMKILRFKWVTPPVKTEHSCFFIRFFFKATNLVTGDIKFKNVHLKHRPGFHHWETHRKLQRCS